MPEPVQEKRPRIVAVANQKGGVGKTTTALNLAAALAETGRGVLVVDLDPQGNATTGLDLSPGAGEASVYDLLVEGAPLDRVVRATGNERLFLVPATGDLASADMALMSAENRNSRLRDALRAPGIARYGLDYAFVDCPPSLNLLTVNAMVAADSILVPLQPEFFALQGLTQLLASVREVRQGPNPALRIEGVVLTMHDRRNSLTHEVEADARENLGDLVFRTVIPRNVRVSEAPSFGQSVLEHDPQSSGARAYRALAEELVERNDPNGKDT